MVSGSVAAGVPRSQQPSQRFAAGDLRSVQEHQQRVMPEGLLPGRRCVLLVIGVIDGDGGIDVQMQPAARRRCRPGRPRRASSSPAGSTDTGQMFGVDALIDAPPHRGRRRRRAEDMLAIPAPLGNPVDAVRAVGDRGGQIGEDISRGMGPRPPIGVGQRRSDLRRESAQVRQLPHHPHPGMRHDALAIGGHFHPWSCCDTLHLRSAFRWNHGS